MSDISNGSESSDEDEMFAYLKEKNVKREANLCMGDKISKNVNESDTNVKENETYVNESDTHVNENDTAHKEEDMSTITNTRYIMLTEDDFLRLCSMKSVNLPDTILGPKNKSSLKDIESKEIDDSLLEGGNLLATHFEESKKSSDIKDTQLDREYDTHSTDRTNMSDGNDSSKAEIVFVKLFDDVTENKVSDIVEETREVESNHGQNINMIATAVSPRKNRGWLVASAKHNPQTSHQEHVKNLFPMNYEDTTDCNKTFTASRIHSKADSKRHCTNVENNNLTKHELSAVETDNNVKSKNSMNDLNVGEIKSVGKTVGRNINKLSAIEIENRVKHKNSRDINELSGVEKENRDASKNSINMNDNHGATMAELVSVSNSIKPNFQTKPKVQVRYERINNKLTRVVHIQDTSPLKNKDMSVSEQHVSLLDKNNGSETKNIVRKLLDEGKNVLNSDELHRHLQPSCTQPSISNTTESQAYSSDDEYSLQEYFINTNEEMDVAQTKESDNDRNTNIDEGCQCDFYTDEEEEDTREESPTVKKRCNKIPDLVKGKNDNGKEISIVQKQSNEVSSGVDSVKKSSSVKDRFNESSGTKEVIKEQISCSENNSETSSDKKKGIRKQTSNTVRENKGKRKATCSVQDSNNGKNNAEKKRRDNREDNSNVQNRSNRNSERACKKKVDTTAPKQKAISTRLRQEMNGSLLSKRRKLTKASEIVNTETQRKENKGEKVYVENEVIVTHTCSEHKVQLKDETSLAINTSKTELKSELSTRKRKNVSTSYDKLENSKKVKLKEESENKSSYKQTDKRRKKQSLPAPQNDKVVINNFNIESHSNDIGNLSKPGIGNLSKPGIGNLSKPSIGNLSKPGNGNLSKPGNGNLSKPGIGNLSKPGIGNLSKPGNKNNQIKQEKETNKTNLNQEKELMKKTSDTNHVKKVDSSTLNTSTGKCVADKTDMSREDAKAKSKTNTNVERVIIRKSNTGRKASPKKNKSKCKEIRSTHKSKKPLFDKCFDDTWKDSLSDEAFEIDPKQRTKPVNVKKLLKGVFSNKEEKKHHKSQHRDKSKRRSAKGAQEQTKQILDSEELWFSDSSCTTTFPAFKFSEKVNVTQG